jgi:amino acid adenylation domain-containing protein
MDGAAVASRLEAAIAQVWRDILGLAEVGADDDFFELGGDSLQAVQMLAAVDELFNASVDFPDFLDLPTVASLAAAVALTRREASPPARPSEPVAGPVPCSSAQERLWFLDQLSGPTGAYNMPLGTRLRGAVDEGALEQALHEIVRRHGALRTTFSAEGGEPFQVIAPEARIDLERRDLTGEPDAESAARELVDAFVSQPFDLERGPLVRALLLRLGPGEQVLELVFDHSICDGWSHIVVFDELAKLYDAYREGRDPALPEPSLQYADHVRRQRDAQTEASLEKPLAYWRERLAGVPAALDLPTDRPRPPLPSYRGRTRRTHLSSELADGVRSFARAERATLFSTLLAVFDVLLFRVSGQETVVVGSTSAARDKPDMQESIGLFASTIAIRADVDGRSTFRQVVADVRRSVLEAVAHQDAPFERLVAELQPERDPSRHPIFQVFFAHVPLARLALEGSEPFDASPSTSRFDLTLWVEEEVEGIDLVWEYATDLFDDATVERLESQFLFLLDAALADPERPVAALPLVGEAGRRDLLARWPGSDVDFPVACLHELFEARVAVDPAAVAVQFEGATLCYGELNERANRLAHRLRGLGVGPESLVALCLERSLDLVVAILGVLKAGGAYVPLDPEYPEERLAFALADLASPVLVTASSLLDRLPSGAGTVLCLDGDASLLERESAENPAPQATPDNAAYVIYTSGSTGRPKGVVVEHRNVARLFTATEHWFAFGEEDTWTLLHSYAFDFSVWEIWGALLHGGRLVVVPQWTTRSPAALRDLIVDERVTVLNATPSLFLSTLDELLAGPEPALRVVVFGGEALHPAALRPWFERFGARGPALVNMYGITETTVHVTYRPVTAADCERDRSPIGEPIPDLALYVLDDALEPTPEGIPGELFVGGAGVARGYLNRPELTAERFLENPFGPGRLYRTGDRARFDHGELAYLGRIDDQVKIRGFRIELGEIQTALTDHPEVRDAVVTTFEGAPGDTRLAAYVVPQAGAGPSIEELRVHLEARLPGFMVPSALMRVDELPLTPNGKLDRSALPPPAVEERESTATVTPATATERRVAEIWQEVLGVDAVGSGDNFFHLGGHSLLAARVVTKVRDGFAIELSVRALFDRPTLAAFAAHVDAAAGRSDDAEPDRVGSTAEAVDSDVHPASFQQQQLMILDQRAPGSPLYNEGLAFRVLGPLDRGALAQAVTTVVGRHEALRTVLALDGGTASQRVLEPVELGVALVPLDELPVSEREPALERLLDEHVRRAFDLRRDVLLRPTLFRLGDEDHVLLFQTHHIVFDAWATEIFYREIAEAYAASLQDREPQLRELPLQYGDFARWQRAWLAGARHEEELTFWRTHLAGAPTFLQLPADGPRRPAAEREAARYTFGLPQHLAEDAAALCDAEGVTPYMLLLAVFATLLYRLTGQDDILVGGPSANRARSEFEGVIGFFANTVATRVRLDGNPTFAALLARVRQSTLATLEHQEVPFEQVVDAVRPARRAGVNPLFQVNFRVRIGDVPTLELHGLTTSRIPVDLGLARFDLAFEAHVRDTGILVELIYATDLFERPRIERLAASFESLLRQAVADPTRALLALELDHEPSIPASAIGIRRFRDAGGAPAAS